MVKVYYGDNEVMLMSISKKTPGGGKSARVIVVGLLGLAVLFLALMRGKDLVLFNPKGEIAQQQMHLMLFSISVLLLVAIPTLGTLYYFAWRYRETNKTAKHDPNRQLGKFRAAGLWIIPISILLLLAAVVLPATHKLDPHKAIVSDTKPLTIQVVALRWKWLFIYPEQGIATVNYVQVPVGTPVQFDLTADEAPMNSFWIPHLGGQLYAMTGHSNRLNLLADTPGDYTGQAAEINGEGFSGMKFVAHATTGENFNRWVQATKLSSNKLTASQYDQLVQPSENNPTALYATVQPGLYDKVLMKYMDSHGNHTEQQ